ncbi:glycosyltransferase family 39 protein, partial [Alteromonas sp. 14N.309.X.WAT.G.H12]
VKTPKRIYANIQEKLGQQKATIALVDFSEQFILFSAYPIVHFGYHTSNEGQLLAAYQWLSRTGEHKYLLVDERLVSEECFDLNQQISVGYAHRKNWLLLPASGLKRRCLDNTTNAVMYRYPHE